MATPGNLGSSVLASKTKTKKKHFVAQKVKLFRASDPLLSVLMWGVNHSINELSHVQIPVMLMPDDFKAYSKIKVDNHLFTLSKQCSEAPGGAAGSSATDGEAGRARPRGSRSVTHIFLPRDHTREPGTR